MDWHQIITVDAIKNQNALFFHQQLEFLRTCHNKMHPKEREQWRNNNRGKLHQIRSPKKYVGLTYHENYELKNMLQTEKQYLKN